MARAGRRLASGWADATRPVRYWRHCLAFGPDARGLGVRVRNCCWAAPGCGCWRQAWKRFGSYKRTCWNVLAHGAAPAFRRGDRNPVRHYACAHFSARSCFWSVRQRTFRPSFEIFCEGEVKAACAPDPGCGLGTSAHRQASLPRGTVNGSSFPAPGSDGNEDLKGGSMERWENEGGEVAPIKGP